VSLAFNHQTASSPLVKNIVFQLRHSATVHGVLGNDIKPGYWFTGSINQYKGTASLDFKLIGSQDEAAVHVKARKSDNNWTMNEVILTPQKHTGQKIDLSGELNI